MYTDVGTQTGDETGSPGISGAAYSSTVSQIAVVSTNDVVDTLQSAADSTTTTMPVLTTTDEKADRDDGATAAMVAANEQSPYWALCPMSQSVLLRAANTMGINFMVFSTTRIQGHEAYQEILQRIKH